MPPTGTPTFDYPLIWPRDMFRSELAAVLTLSLRDIRAALERLFEEAMWGPSAIEDLRHAPQVWPNYGPDGEWGSSSLVAEPAYEFGRRLLAAVNGLPTYAPRRYFRDRDRDPSKPLDHPTTGTVQGDWIRVVRDLDSRGYLDRRAGPSYGSEHEKRVRDLIEQHCGLKAAWPFNPSGRDAEDEDFLTLVEVFHDLVARHRHSGTGPGQFDDAAGQAIYRWKVNNLFARHEVHLELAAAGEDRGLVVRTVPDPRTDLLDSAARDKAGSDQDVVAHAVALFRSRSATRQEKRSACVALAGVLESRRQLLKVELLSHDEGALFQIANQFAIRHQKADQRADYDDAYLDWIFWWYLATVELTNRLLRRTGTDHGQ